MLNINNNANQIKTEILIRIIKLQLEGNLKKGVHYIPKQMAPKTREPYTCCIYHDREILRQRVIARLGCAVENMDEDAALEDFATEALERESPTWPILTVLHEACHACVHTKYLVTNACQGCLARPCSTNCPKSAITITNHHAKINENMCSNCGLCMQNCPYHAIIKIPVPCEESCPVGAITKDETGREVIDFHKCIFCGNCMRSCPFSAMMDKSQIVDVLKHIMNGKKVTALYAPAIASQFKVDSVNLEQALMNAGFTSVLEVAVGADICADKEAKEFTERMERGDRLMTTSCCSAYVRAVRKHVPDLIPCISETRSPMHYTAEIAKKTDPDCVTVFIGPCLAKRREGLDDPMVDYVLSVEEVKALFIAKEIDPEKTEVKDEKILNKKYIPTSSGRNFAQSGGVFASIKTRLKNPEILRPTVINGLNKKGMAQLAMYGKINAGKMPAPPNCPNLIEVMACEGGCIAGPGVIANPNNAMGQLTKYVDAGNKELIDGIPAKCNELDKKD
ncbi:MAG: 4Fe-4S binding protein [Treponema sp.]|nr:4Fe-4S binding protein [Treponema sp.]